MTALWGRMAWHGSRWEKCALMKAKDRFHRLSVVDRLFPPVCFARGSRLRLPRKPKGTIMGLDILGNPGDVGLNDHKQNSAGD